MKGRICLWSGPRNISTALMYSFAQRIDTHVVDEPFYACYLKNNPEKIAYHPGAHDILEQMESDEEQLVRFILGPFDQEVVFFKHMAHHLRGMNLEFLKETQNVILTRHPRDVIRSFTKVIENPTIEDIGYLEQLDVLNFQLKIGQKPTVVDGKLIRNQPEEMLRRMCDALGIDFDLAMLSWKAGPIPEDGLWAKYWYHNVHQSTGFLPAPENNSPLENRYEQLLHKSIEIYEQLMHWSL